MKAILVIDMPSSCVMCGIRWSCKIWNKWKGYNDRLDGCPLKPLPCKKYMRQMPSDVLEKDKRKRDFIIHKVDVDNSYVEGWNDCLDAITGETE